MRTMSTAWMLVVFPQGGVVRVVGDGVDEGGRVEGGDEEDDDEVLKVVAPQMWWRMLHRDSDRGRVPRCNLRGAMEKLKSD